MDYSIIVIGDELLIGQVTDTNSGWMARHLSPFGWRAKWVKVIADEATEIEQAIGEAFAQTDVVLMTGGLGPTKDDITKPTLCRYFGGEMVYDNDTARNVLKVVEARHLTINEYTRAQAMVPNSCRVIQNQVGTAPIMWFEREGKVLVSMPGVPFETETMMRREVIPQLMQRFHSDVHIAFRNLVVVGIIESLLAMKLDEFERQLPQWMHLAYLPQTGWIKLRLTAMNHDDQLLNDEIDRQVNRLHQILGDAIVADDDIPLAAIVGNILRDRGLTLASAESCTGGNIAHVITEVAGSSDYFVGSVVSYATRVKIDQLGVNADDIERHTVVSQTVAEQMATGVCRLLQADCAMATTGIAGPSGGTPDNPVGTVWMAARVGERIVSQRKHYPGSRARVIARATTDALLLLLSLLQN